MINYYRILNVSEIATDIQIKKAFRKLAIKFHPDKTKNQNSDEFIKIKKAYEILINLNSRKKYDKELYNFRNPPQPFKEVDIRNLNETFYRKATLGEKVLNIIIRLTIASIFLIAVTYSCEFIENHILGGKKTYNNDSTNLNESDFKTDSLRNEDSKIEKEFENTHENKQTNGDIKF